MIQKSIFSRQDEENCVLNNKFVQLFSQIHYLCRKIRCFYICFVIRFLHLFV